MNYLDKNSIVIFNIVKSPWQGCQFGEYFELYFWNDQNDKGISDQLMAQLLELT